MIEVSRCIKCSTISYRNAETGYTRRPDVSKWSCRAGKCDNKVWTSLEKEGEEDE